MLLNIDMDDPEILKGGKFLAAFIIIFVVISSLLSLLPLQGIEIFFALPTLEVLKIFGFRGALDAGSEPVLILLQSLVMPISISYLCCRSVIIWNFIEEKGCRCCCFCSHNNCIQLFQDCREHSGYSLVWAGCRRVLA